MAQQQPKDRICYCERCGISFLWSQEEQKAARQSAADALPAEPSYCPGCRKLVTPTERERGIVKWYHRRKRYGFILRQDNDDLFAHGSAIVEGGALREGDLVEFQVGKSDRGPVAEEIRVLAHAGNDETDD